VSTKKENDMSINLKETEFELALEMLKTCAADHMALDPDDRDFTWTEMKDLIDKFEGAKT